MKHNCEKEFDLNRIFQKLAATHHTPTVPADQFFSRESELSMLQKKMEKIMFLRKKDKQNRSSRLW